MPMWFTDPSEWQPPSSPFPKRFDVLFFGAMNPMRMKVCDRARKLGMRVLCSDKLWGRELERHILETKVRPTLRVCMVWLIVLKMIDCR